MNFVKKFVFLSLVMSNFLVTASFNYFESKKSDKEINLASVCFGYKKGKLYAQAEEEPSWWRKAFGLKGKIHKTEMGSMIVGVPEDCQFSQNGNFNLRGSGSLTINSYELVEANNDVIFSVACCIACFNCLTACCDNDDEKED